MAIIIISFINKLIDFNEKQLKVCVRYSSDFEREDNSCEAMIEILVLTFSYNRDGLVIHLYNMTIIIKTIV